MNGALAAWGPSLLICLTIVLEILFNNSRISDLRSYIDARFNDVDKRFNAVDKRFDDMKDFIKSEVRRLEDRQSPIHRA
jgi:hypothetical protein